MPDDRLLDAYIRYRQQVSPEYEARIRQERNRTMLERLKNLQIDTINLDDAVSLAAFGRAVEAEYGQVGAEAPDWLTSNMKQLRTEIRHRLQDTLERELKEDEARLEALASADEKREKLRERIAARKAKLGVGA